MSDMINGWDRQHWDEIYMPRRARANRIRRIARVAALLAAMAIVASLILFAWSRVSASSPQNDLSVPIASNSSGVSSLKLLTTISTPTASTPVSTPTPVPLEETCIVCVPTGIPFPRSARYLTLTCRFLDPKRPRHVGIDISVEEKMEILATMDGLVTRAAYDDVYGNKVVITNEHYETWYAHNSYLLVREGDYVHAGDVIALSGNTGASGGPHLHYEVREDGVPRNPQLYLGEDAVRIATDECIKDEPPDETDEPSR